MSTDIRSHSPPPARPSPARPPLAQSAKTRGAEAPAPGPAVRTATAKTKIAGLAVVCAKCAKRQGLRPKDIGGLLKDAYHDLAPAPAEGGKKAKRGKLRIVESGCLGPCPKRSVAVATGASLAAGLLPEFGPIAGLAAAVETTGAGKDPPGFP